MGCSECQAFLAIWLAIVSAIAFVWLMKNACHARSIWVHLACSTVMVFAVRMYNEHAADCVTSNWLRWNNSTVHRDYSVAIILDNPSVDSCNQFLG